MPEGMPWAYAFMDEPDQRDIGPGMELGGAMVLERPVVDGYVTPEVPLYGLRLSGWSGTQGASPPAYQVPERPVSMGRYERGGDEVESDVPGGYEKAFTTSGKARSRQAVETMRRMAGQGRYAAGMMDELESNPMTRGMIRPQQVKAKEKKHAPKWGATR